jgi:hypothetical protein
MTTAIPEQGQIVPVRSRQWMFKQFKSNFVPGSALELAGSWPTHLRTLSSVGDSNTAQEPEVLGGSDSSLGRSCGDPYSRDARSGGILLGVMHKGLVRLKAVSSLCPRESIPCTTRLRL